jgi:hypothetical protein
MTISQCVIAAFKYRINDIVDVDIDFDNETIVLSISTSSVPVFIQSYEPLYAGRIIYLQSQE